MWNAFPPPGLGFALSQAAPDPILCGSGVVSHDSPPVHHLSAVPRGKRRPRVRPQVSA